MSEGISGKVTIPKLTLDRDVLNSEPANRKSAFLDLNAWANDRPRTIKIGGADVRLDRGQLAYSQQTLAKLWRWDKDKVHRVLSEFQNEGLITFNTSNRTTTITVLDYTIYNRDTTPEPEAGTDTEPEAGTDAKTDPEPEQKLEVGRGKKEGGGDAREPDGEIPSDCEVLAFAAAFPGEPASAAPGPIPQAFAEGWLSRMLGRMQFPPRWQRSLVADWRAGFRGFAAGGHVGNGVQKKPAEKTAGLSPVAARIALEAERRKVAARIESSPVRPDTDTDLNFYPPEKLAALRSGYKADKALLAELDARLAELGEQP